MTNEKPYNKFIKKPTNSNVLMNVTLLFGFLVIVFSQVYLFKIMAQGRTRTSNPSDPANDTTASSNIVLTASNIQLTSCSDDDLSNAVALVKPSIVNIDVVSSDVSSSTQRRGGPALNFDMPSQQSLVTNEETLGSGIIVDEQGYILTCYHLIKGNKAIYVTLFNSQQKSYKADIVSVDGNNDLALLKIYPDVILPKAKLGNSDLVQITDTVLTIGSPFGFEYTVTGGIISDNKRSLIIDGNTYYDLFQTDAAINRGSAGGALINGDGEVIGINTAIVSSSDTFVGAGFAIPINKARPLLLQAMWD